MASSVRRPVWVVTGASSGIGQAIALEAARFATVVAVGRSAARLEPVVRAGCRALELDVTSSSEQLAQAVAGIAEREGTIDVLVNAAGYLLEGAAEETSDHELQQLFDTIALGPLRLARSVLPLMRRARAGVIANVAGIGALRGSPNAGPYCAAKAALSTLTEAMHDELAPLGVRVCLVQLGHFRTNFLQPGHRRKVQAHISDYDAVLDPIRAAFDGLNGAQQGDPLKGAQAIVKVLAGPEVPPLLAVGPDVPAAELRAHDQRRAQILAWQHIGGGTDLQG
ncbi:Short-chain dehydrogenase/reductase SDR [Lasiodiplodia theobromae]|uniref:Short-chain dehydrogenase/reductase SDR n=1 Tax=Lasiodiplodia theobromae TaxID=45133 RepID=UPI0015C3626D|nr:Short-chain dehydrogenase/reductase SDR [Lasiodiplodia theobromae]KAF4543307.1 Short-chain dehydrogenase/reductase SDR [Lasiodiplodia theobromae]